MNVVGGARPSIWTLLVGAIAYLLATGCYSPASAIAQSEAPQAAPAAQTDDSELGRTPASRANIRIVPGETGPGKTPSLRFCYHEGSAYDPQIRQIRMARVTGDKKVYEVVAVGNGFLWGEWRVGTVPRGFKLLKGDRLSAGVYEIYVDGGIGEGEIRVSIDDSGNIKRLPWDEFDKTYGEACDLSGGTSPRFISSRSRSGCVFLRHVGESNKPIWGLRICEGAPLDGKWVGGNDIAMGLAPVPFKRVEGYVLGTQDRGKACKDCRRIGPSGTFVVSLRSDRRDTVKYRVPPVEACGYLAGFRLSIGDANDALVRMIDETRQRLGCASHLDRQGAAR